MVYNWLIFDRLRWHLSFCRLCAAPTDGPGEICPDCLADLPHNLFPCPRCGAVLAHPVSIACGVCQRRPPQFDSAHIPYRYAPPLIPFLTGLKFQAQLANARWLGELLLGSVNAAAVPLPECLIPVPLHPLRLRERGFNQALELARPLSRQLHLPLEPHLVRRRRHTPPQSGLAGTTRRRNLRGAFEVNKTVTYQHVALIDDVVTTGSTLNELARVLRQSGVKFIQIWAVARA